MVDVREWVSYREVGSRTVFRSEVGVGVGVGSSTRGDRPLVR